MKVRKTILAVLLFLLIAVSAFSATYYDNGSQRFTITAGPTFPLTLTTNGETYVGMGLEGTKMKLGGYGSIAYQVFLTDYVAIGGEIGYDFNYTVDDTLFTAVPMLFKTTIFPLQTGRIDLPISLGIGASYLSLSGTGSHLTPFVNAEVGLDYYFNDNWGMGVKSGIWLVPELFAKSTEYSNTALTTFIPVTLSVTYRQ